MSKRQNNRFGAVYPEGKTSTIEKIQLFLVALVLVYVPLIMRISLYDAKISNLPWFLESEHETDIFLRNKAIALVSIAACMVIMLVFILSKSREKLKKQYWLYPLFGYAFLSVISTILSPYRYYGFNGFYEQHESLWVLLSYCVVTFFSYVAIESEQSIQYILYALLFLAVILSFIGLSQLIGKDFFESDFAKAIIIPQGVEKQYGYRENLAFGFSGSGNHQVYLTMYNPNYVGMFSALVFPVFISISLATKKLGMRLFWGSLAVIHFVLAMGSGSKTFLGSFLVSGIVAAVIYRRKWKQGMKFMIAFGVILLVTTASYFYFIKTNPITYLQNALNTKENENRVGGLELFQDKFFFTYNQDKIEVQFDKNVMENKVVSFKDKDGKEIPYDVDEEGILVLKRETYQDVSFYLVRDNLQNREVMDIFLPEGNLRVSNEGDSFTYLTQAGKKDTVVDAESAVIKNHDAFASGRGYIWSRTFPLIKKHLFIGSGADSFTLEFPQNDYIGKLNGGFRNMLITKPHNLYMQIAVQTGLLSAFCYLILALIFVTKGIKYFLKYEVDNRTKAFAAALVLGIVGYLVSGIFNDSIVAVAPIYWCLLGVGFGVIRILEKEIKE